MEAEGRKSFEHLFTGAEVVDACPLEPSVGEGRPNPIRGEEGVGLSTLAAIGATLKKVAGVG